MAARALVLLSTIAGACASEPSEDDGFTVIDRAVEVHDDHLVFEREGNQFLLDLPGGHILIGTAGDGFFRKLDAVTEQADQIRVATSIPSLEEAARYEEFRASLAVGGNGGDGGDSADAIGLIGVTVGHTTIIPGDAEVTASGRFDADMDLEVSGSIRDEIVTALRGSVNGWLTLHLRAKAGLSASNQVDVWTQRLPAQTFFIGPVPVVIVPKVAIQVGASVSTSTDLDMEVTLELNGWSEWRLSFDRYKDLPEADASGTLTVGGDAPAWQLDATAGVKGWVNASVSFDFYDIIGPEFALSPYVELTADGAYAGVEARVQVAKVIPLLQPLGGLGLVKFSTQLIRERLD